MARPGSRDKKAKQGGVGPIGDGAVAKKYLPQGMDVRTVAGQLEIAVDTNQLDVPTRSMSANYAAVYKVENELSIVFGQRNPFSKRLFAALVVAIPASEARKYLVIAADRMRRTLGKYLEDNGMSGFRSQPESLEIPERTLLERATIVTAYFLDQEADILLYRMSPVGVHQLKSGRKSELLYPILKVQLSSVLLSSILNEISSLTDEPAPESGE